MGDNQFSLLDPHIGKLNRRHVPAKHVCIQVCKIKYKSVDMQAVTQMLFLLDSGNETKLAGCHTQYLPKRQVLRRDQNRKTTTVFSH